MTYRTIKEPAARGSVSATKVRTVAASILSETQDIHTPKTCVVKASACKRTAKKRVAR